MQTAWSDPANAVDFRSLEIYHKLQNAKSQDLFSYLHK